MLKVNRNFFLINLATWIATSLVFTEDQFLENAFNNKDIASLIKVIEDRNIRYELRLSALTEISRIKSPDANSAISQLLENFNTTSDEDFRSILLTGLREIVVANPSILSIILPKLDHPRKEVRIIIIELLGYVGVDLRQVFPELVKILQYNDSDTQVAALESLKNIGIYAKTAISSIVECITITNSQRVQIAGIQALAAIGWSEKSRESLTAFLAFQDEIIQQEAAIALATIDARTDVLKPLMKALENNKFETRREAIRALANLNEKAIPAVPLLIKVLEEDDPLLGVDAARAIWAIDSALQPKILESLIKLLNSAKRVEILIAAVNLIAKMGSAAKKSLPVLMQILNDKQYHTRKFQPVRAAIVIALGQLDTNNSQVISALEKSLGDEDAFVRLSALESIFQLTQDIETVKIIFDYLVIPTYEDYDTFYIHATCCSIVRKIGIPAKKLLHNYADKQKIIKNLEKDLSQIPRYCSDDFISTIQLILTWLKE